MKIIWHSVAPWIGTGYGQQSAQVLRRLRDAGHDVAVSGYAGIEGAIGALKRGDAGAAEDEPTGGDDAPF